MTIIIPIESLAFELFPNTRTDKVKLKEELMKYYEIDSIKPQIKIQDDFITIEIDHEEIKFQQSRFEGMLYLL